MWCPPELLQSKNGVVYDICEQNEFFEIQHCKKSPSTMDLVKIYVNKIISHKDSEITNPYRIILKGDKQYVVAVAAIKDEIDAKWQWIKQEILPIIDQYKSNNIQDSQALIEFLKVKFDSLASIQEKETLEHRNEEFNKLFNLKNEILVSVYPCILYKVGGGSLYVSENYLCFLPAEQNEKLIIPFKDVSVIKKRSWLQDPAISITTKKKNDYYWSSFSNSRDEAFGVIEQLWHQTFSKILKSNEAISNLSSSLNSSAPSQKTIDSHFDIQSLEKAQTSLRNNKLLRLPLYEKHIFEVSARTWEGRSEKSIQLFVSHYFISFQTRTGKIFRATIPFREIFNMTKEDKMIGGNTKAIKLIHRTRRFIFLFDNVNDRNNTYDNIIDRWNKVTLECDLICFTPFISPASVTQVGMSHLVEDRREFTSTYFEKQIKMEQFWVNYFNKHGTGSGLVEDLEYLQHLLRQGAIPDKVRSWIWPVFSGATNKAHSAPFLGYYQSLLDSNIGQFSKAIDEIEKDLLRSFPEHPYFSTEAGITSLRNVLTAYSWRNPNLGYCQSMNIIASLLLCFLDEENAFWTLAAICEDLAPENYDKNMIGNIVDAQAFEDLIARFLPTVFTHLKTLSIPISVISQSWFLCLFVGYLPLEATLRTLDNFFFSRGKTLFAMGLAVLKCCEQRILLAKEAEELMILLKDLHDIMKDEEMMNFLLKMAYDFLDQIDTDSLIELRGFRKFKAVKEVQKTTRNTTIRTAMERGSKFELHELHRLYDYYYSEANSEFLINFEQFSSIITKILPWIRWRMDLIKPFFQKIDSSNKGVIDFFSFLEGVYIVSNGTLREKLQFYFQLHDNGHNGLFDKGDYYKILDAIARSFLDDNIREADLMCLVTWTYDQTEKVDGERISFDAVSRLLLSEDSDDVHSTTNQPEGLLEHFLKLS